MPSRREGAARGRAERASPPRRGAGSASRRKMLAPALLVLAAVSIFPFIYIILMSLSRVRADRRDLLRAGSGWTTGRGCSATARCGALGALGRLLRADGRAGDDARRDPIALAINETRARAQPDHLADAAADVHGAGDRGPARALPDRLHLRPLRLVPRRDRASTTGDILGSPTSAFLAVTLMDVWEWTPLIALIVLAGLTSVPKPVLEAAAMDGASYFKRLRYIVLPMIAGVMIVALLIRSMDAIRYFDIITNTTNGGPADATKIVPIRLYETAFRFFDLGYAAAIGLSMLVVTIIMANVFLGILKRRGLAQMKDSGTQDRPARRARRDHALDARPDHLDGAVLVQAERGPHRDAAEGRLLADARPLPGAVQRRQRHRPVHLELDARRGRLDDHRRRAGLPRRLRPRALVASAARTTSRSGSSPSAWRRSRRSSCRCS